MPRRGFFDSSRGRFVPRSGLPQASPPVEGFPAQFSFLILCLFQRQSVSLLCILKQWLRQHVATPACPDETRLKVFGPSRPVSQPQHWNARLCDSATGCRTPEAELHTFMVTLRDCDRDSLGRADDRSVKEAGVWHSPTSEFRWSARAAARGVARLGCGLRIFGRPTCSFSVYSVAPIAAVGAPTASRASGSKDFAPGDTAKSGGSRSTSTRARPLPWRDNGRPGHRADGTAGMPKRMDRILSATPINCPSAD